MGFPPPAGEVAGGGAVGRMGQLPRLGLAPSASLGTPRHLPRLALLGGRGRLLGGRSAVLVPSLTRSVGEVADEQDAPHRSLEPLPPDRGIVFGSEPLGFHQAAALPEVGREEVMLCYLPLFHTFGRYLEMMGMLFWGGTYVFAGNPSLDSLLNGLREVRPTGLISIPHRWQQIRDHLHQNQNRDRRLLRWLEHNAVTRCQGWRQLPGGHGQCEFP